MKHKLESSIDSSFWNYITKKKSFRDVINFKDVDKISFLKKLEKDVNSFHHHFLQPNYYYYPKSSGILRAIKDFSLADFCTYYYSTKSIQDELVKVIKKNSRSLWWF